MKTITEDCTKEITEFKGAIAGFELYGYRQLNNTIKAGDRFIDKWPETVTFLGNTYGLEEVVRGSVDSQTGIQFENAIYA